MGIKINVLKISLSTGIMAGRAFEALGRADILAEAIEKAILSLASQRRKKATDAAMLGGLAGWLLLATLGCF